MKMPTLHDKLLELYVKKDEPDNSSLKRSVENYFHKKYSDKKLQRLIDQTSQLCDFKNEASAIKCRNHLSSYIDSIILSRIRDSFKSSKTLDIDDMEELKFKALVKQIILNYGYEVLFVPGNSQQSVDIIVHRGDVKIAILALKCAPGNSVGPKTVRQTRYIADHYHCEQAILISSTYFEPEAVSEARDLGVTLLDKDKLVPLVKDLIDNRQRKENEFLISGIDTNKNTIFLDALIKSQKTKVQVAFIKYHLDPETNFLKFEGELVNTGKKPVSDLMVEIKIFDRAADCVFKKISPVREEKLNSKEKVNFSVVFDDILESDWNNICRYELKLDYSNLYAE